MSKKDELLMEWLKKADEDLAVAETLLEYSPQYTDTICFHCQQAVEKYLKAHLIRLDIEFQKTHSLSYLLDLIADKEDVPDKMYSKAEELQDYAINVRYPDFTETTVDDAKEAYKIALEFKHYYKKGEKEPDENN